MELKISDDKFVNYYDEIYKNVVNKLIKEKNEELVKTFIK